MTRQLLSLLNSTGLLPSLQSAYWVNHSTEAAVLKVLSDILLDIDSVDLSALVLLDLSATFDTVDHDIEILLRRLDTSFLVSGTALLCMVRVLYLQPTSMCLRRFNVYPDGGIPQ